MRLIVAVSAREGYPPETKLCSPGDPLTFSIVSDYLVSAGQAIDIGVSVFDADAMVLNQMGPKADARHLVREDNETPLIDLPVTWDVSFIPSTRLLADILADAVQHGRDYPHHGVNCACMDQFAREVRLQISKALPPDNRTTDTDWAQPIQERLDAKARVRWVLELARKAI